MNLAYIYSPCLQGADGVFLVMGPILGTIQAWTVQEHCGSFSGALDVLGMTIGITSFARTAPNTFEKKRKRHLPPLVPLHQRGGGPTAAAEFLISVDTQAKVVCVDIQAKVLTFQ